MDNRLTGTIFYFYTEILKILLRDEALAEDVDLKQLAKRTESFSGSDLKRGCSRNVRAWYLGF